MTIDDVIGRNAVHIPRGRVVRFEFKYKLRTELDNTKFLSIILYLSLSYHIISYHIASIRKCAEKIKT